MPLQEPPDLTGRILSRTYQVECVLGEGGMGAVYRVRHLRTGGILAVKMLHREVSQNADVYRRFQEEARITSALRHPNIVQVTDFDQDEDGTPFLVMEWLDGEDLFERLNRCGNLPLDTALDMARQVGVALQAAHEKGVIHRDVKPHNIFFARHDVAGESFEVVKVVDFGLSKIRRAAGHQTREQVVAGTPYYMAPEVARGQSAQLDGRADQFSLAVVLYRTLCGRLPFDDDDVMGVIYKVLNHEPMPLGALVPYLPVHVGAAIARAMSKERERRFPNMTEFVRALTGQEISGVRRAVSSRPSLPPTIRLPAVPPSSGSTSWPNRTLTSATGQFVQSARSRRVRPAAAVAAACALGVALLIGATWPQASGFQPDAPVSASAPASRPPPPRPASPPPRASATTQSITPAAASTPPQRRVRRDRATPTPRKETRRPRRRSSERRY